MLRLLAAAAVLVFSVSAGAGPLSRWTVSGVEGGRKLVSGGPVGAPALVLLRDSLDPMRSFDGGRTWAPFTVNGLRPLDVSIAPSDGRTWYAATTPDEALAASPRMIWRTRDGGDTWEQRSPVTNRYTLAPEIGDEPDTLYLLKYRLPFCGFLCEGTSASIVTSRDGGLTWVDDDPAMQAFRVAVSPADSRVAMATGAAPGGGPGGAVMRTEDGGRTWATLQLPPPSMSSLTWVLLYNGEIALDRRDPLIAYVRPEQRASAVAEDIYSTRDGGRTWSRARQPQGALTADPSTAGRVFLFAFDGSVRESRDAGLTWVVVEAGGSFTRGNNDPHFESPPTSVVLHEGRRIAAFAESQKVARLDLTDGALALGSDLWWNPAAPGTGLTITQHASNQVFVVWYAYDAAGKQVWRAMPGGAWHDRILTGTLYETTGPAFFQGAFDPSAVGARAIGTATIDFRDQDNATFTFGDGSGNVHGRMDITRQLFGDPARAGSESFADLWWNESQSGWGIGISHQGDRVFATWYVHGDDGQPLWIVMPDAVLANTFVGAVVRPLARGDLYTTAWPPDASAPVATRVGTASILFRDGDRADLEYTSFGRTATVPITRQPF